MDARTESGNYIDVKKRAQAHDFRWENLRPFEENIMRIYQSSDTSGLQNALEAYWSLWDTKLHGLDSVRQIDFYFETTSLIPEERRIILDEGYLGVVTVKDK